MKQLRILFLGMLLAIPTSYSQSGLMIFLDHSSSMLTASEFGDTENRTIKQLLIKHLKSNGDFVVVSYLFSNTASISNRKEYTFNFKPMSTKGLSGKQLELRKLNNQQRKRQYKSSLVKRIMNDMKVDDAKANSSEILESLVQVSRTKASKLSILYISDMEEASDYRIFSRIKSVSESIAAGKNDTKQLMSDYSLSVVYVPTTITCYFSTNTLDNRASLKYVENYWREVFKTFFKHAQVTFQNF